MDEQIESEQAASPPEGQRAQRTSLLLRPLVIAAIALGVAVMALGAAVALSVPAEKGGARAVDHPVGGPITYHPLPPFIADLKSTRARRHFLQVAAVVELTADAVEALQREETPIVSEVQSRLRDLNNHDLTGGAGVERLRADLLAIINRRIAPAEARDVLFTRFLMD